MNFKHKYTKYDAPYGLPENEKEAWADKMNTELAKEKNKLTRKIILIVSLVLIVLIAVSSATIISEGNVGVKYRFGQITSTDMEPGLHFVIPFIDTVKRVDTTEQIYTTEVSSYTKDTQTVDSLVLQANYYYDKAQLDTLVRQIGLKNVESKLVMPNLQSVLKNEVGKYKAEELIANRSALEMSIQEELTSILSKYGVIVSRIAIQDIEFNAAFEQVVEEKVQAEQKALKVQNETIQKEEEAKQQVIAAEAEAKATLVKAQAEAEANKLLNNSLTSTLVEYYKIEKWNGEFPEVMGNTVNPFVTIGE